MKRITNTAKNQRLVGAVMGGNPGAIEAQEKTGQKELISSQQLPVKGNGADAVAAYHKLGIIIKGKSKDDPLFLDVELPAGWTLQETDHSMWSRLIDDQGKERASIFYKAAFYDRDAFINFNN